MKCSEYAYGDWEDFLEYPRPCHCPICGGFLSWDGQTPICNKCKTELMIFPEVDEETGEDLEWGKICPISEVKQTLEEQTQ